jgi:peptide-methionine (R)-S-oxide reductase
LGGFAESGNMLQFVFVRGPLIGERSMKPEMQKERSESGYDITPLSSEAIENLAIDLNEEERRVLLNHGTEAPFCGTLLDNKLDGTYACRLCGLPLFSSKHKFNSGTGWPSFYTPFDKDHLTNIEDNTYGMRRIEIRCARCGGHQGHVFPDGPPPTGQRYCLNSASLQFFEEGEDIPQRTT